MSVDYLQPANRVARVLSCIACFAATAVCWLFVAIAVVGLRRSDSSVADQKTAWFIVVFFSLLGSATAAIAYRLMRGKVTANQVTTMPVWFIQSFGVFFLIGMALVAIFDGKWLLAIEGTSLAIAMIFIGRSIANRHRLKPNKAPEPTTTAVTDRATHAPRQP